MFFKIQSGRQAVHAFNPGTQEEEPVEDQSVLSTKGFPLQPGLHGKIVSKEITTRRNSQSSSLKLKTKQKQSNKKPSYFI